MDVLDLLILQIFHHEEPMLELIWQKFAPRITALVSSPGKFRIVLR